MSAVLHVCALAQLPETALASRAGSLLTLLSPGMTAVRPATIGAERHLVLNLSDIEAPRPGLTHPGEAHVEAMLAFFRAWDRRAPMLIHCYAGVSRSTAAAFIALCALVPQRNEASHAQALRNASPTATPNPRLVALADAALGRDGQMVAAIKAIGRGAECFAGAPFSLPLHP